MKKKKCKLFKKFQNAPLWAAFGIWSGKPWRCKWSSVWGFSNFGNVHAWVKAGFAIQYLNTHISGMLKLEALAFFSKSADEVVGAFNGGIKSFSLRVSIACLKLPTTKQRLLNA